MKRFLISVIFALSMLTGTLLLPVYAEAKTETVKNPVSSLKSGSYYLYEITKASLSCETEGADIYYSVNKGKYKLYNDNTQIALTANTDLRIYAEKDGAKSKVVLYKYRFKPKFKISHGSGNYDGPQTIFLESVTSNIDYYYTLDGSTPTERSPKYTSKGIFADESCTLRILAVRKNWTKVYLRLNLDIKPEPDTPDEMLSMLSSYGDKYCFNALTDTQKTVYSAFYAMAETHTEKKNIRDLRATPSDISAAYWAFDYDNPQFFWLGSGYGGQRSGSIIDNLHLSFSRTVNEADSQSEKFKKMADALVLEALQYTDTVERIKFIHDTVILNTEYTISRDKYIYEADGPIVYGKALCEGYAKAFMYLCQATGIECICVSNPEHTWNMVKIKKRWYHVDVTYDDINALNSICSYKYFLVSTETMLEERDIQCFFEIPESVVDYKHNFS
ncbi:MAG: chitobiase/beta-hexosaminidase C-terminal domain-containing protein [Oscillospiraceae bacterium]|nr:chitobiase/beta-hexosaminidase C-terminal domain-containing protein [Oscillospiraceae bacterium]